MKIRQQQRTRIRVLAGCVALAIIAGVGLTMLGGSGPERDRYRRPLSGDSLILSTVQIIIFDGQIARFDTETGEIAFLRGNLDNPSTQKTWQVRVQKVRGKTSGLLEIQHVANRLFLVDTINGRTWLLNKRGSNGTWDEIRTIR